MTQWHLPPEHKCISQVPQEPKGCICVEIYHKILTHQYCRLKSLRTCSQQAGHPTIADVSVLVQSQEKTDVPPQWLDRRSPFLLLRWSDFLFCSGLQLIAQDPPHYGE